MLVVVRPIVFSANNNEIHWPLNYKIFLIKKKVCTQHDENFYCTVNVYLFQALPLHLKTPIHSNFCQLAWLHDKKKKKPKKPTLSESKLAWPHDKKKITNPISE